MSPSTDLRVTRHLHLHSDSRLWRQLATGSPSSSSYTVVKLLMPLYCYVVVVVVVVAAGVACAEHASG